MRKLCSLSTCCSLMLIFLYACKPESSTLVLQKGEVITESFQLEQDSLFLAVETGEYGLQIRRDSLLLDFNDALIIGKNFGQVPNLQTGVAIKANNLKSIHIKNAHFLGFEKGIEVENVDQLILENCSFQHFYRNFSAAEASEVHNSLGLIAINTSNILIRNCTFNQLQTGVGVYKGNRLELQNCQMQFLSESAIAAGHVEEIVIDSSELLYVAYQAGNDYALDVDSAQMEITNSALVHLRQWELSTDAILNNNNLLAYWDDDIYLSHWDSLAANQLITEKGISTTELKLVDDWGIYDFSYPEIWLRDSSAIQDVFLITGPVGNWRLIDGEGYLSVNPKTGSFPQTLVAQKDTSLQKRNLVFEYLGKTAFSFGKKIPSGQVVPFSVQIE